MKNDPNIIKTSILLIDTAPETNRQLHAALGGVFDLVYTTTTATDLDNILKRAAPSLVIFEIFDAGKSGFNKCREITFNDGIRDLPVVVIISAHEVDHMSTGYYMGASDYMVKPLIPAEVLARVGGQLEMASASRAIREIDQSFADEPSLAAVQQYENEIGNATILVVDDCIDSLEPLTQVLANSYEVYSAQNGHEALELTQKHRFDLILLDVVMPDMSGYDVCQALKKNNATAHIPIIFLTGQSESRHETHGLTMGAVDYILKPASLSVVLARVRAHLLNAHQQKTLSILTYQDHLTQIPNRRRFNETLKLEHKRAIRDKTPLSILMIDIDQFKRFNDYFGHLKGDECLKAVGQALVGCHRRPADLTCRFGGEEFVALLPDSDEEGALHIAKLMLQAVEALRIEQTQDAEHPFVTVSIGTATMYPNIICSDKQLMGAADKMLYNAKLNGRNCIQSEKLQCAIA